MTDFYSSNITQIGKIDISRDLSTDSKIMLLGSCFSSNLHNYLESKYLNSKEAPFGNVYNPLSIANSLEVLTQNRKIDITEVIEVDGLFQHFDFYSKLGESDKKSFVKNINRSIEDGHNYLKECNTIIITLGTAFVFEKEGKVVNNCHKLPGKVFSRRSLEIGEIVERLETSISGLRVLNKNIKIIFTLSPVRHLRDSFTDNSLSKALLRVSIDRLVTKLNIEYFPSYEILIDELRDYRWYSSDLTHPSSVAVDHIMNLFINSVGDNRLLNYIKDIDKLNKMLNHRIINPDSESSINFIKTRVEKLKKIVDIYSEVEKLKMIKLSQYP